MFFGVVFFNEINMLSLILNIFSLFWGVLICFHVFWCCSDVSSPIFAKISGSCSETTLCCIFHLRDFHCCNNHTISALCQEPGQAELIMFVLARFLAHWTTAIVLNSVLRLIQHSHFLALTQEIKFPSKGLLWSPSRESNERGIGRKKK